MDAKATSTISTHSQIVPHFAQMYRVINTEQIENEIALQLSLLQLDLDALREEPMLTPAVNLLFAREQVLQQ